MVKCEMLFGPTMYKTQPIKIPITSRGVPTQVECCRSHGSPRFKLPFLPRDGPVHAENYFPEGGPLWFLFPGGPPGWPGSFGQVSAWGHLQTGALRGCKWHWSSDLKLYSSPSFISLVGLELTFFWLSEVQKCAKNGQKNRVAKGRPFQFWPQAGLIPAAVTPWDGGGIFFDVNFKRNLWFLRHFSGSLSSSSPNFQPLLPGGHPGPHPKWARLFLLVLFAEIIWQFWQNSTHDGKVTFGWIRGG